MINPTVTQKLAYIAAEQTKIDTAQANIAAALQELAALVPQVADPPPPPPPPDPDPVEEVPPTGAIPKLSTLAASVQPSLIDGVFLTPVAVEKNGVWTLFVTAKDKYGADKLSFPITVRYILDKQRLGTAVADPAVSISSKDGKLYAPLVIDKPANGLHAVTLRIIGAAQPSIRVQSSDFTVGQAPANLPSYTIPVHGQTSASERYCRAVYDEITWPGGNTRPLSAGKARAVTLPMGMTEAGLNPKGMTSISQFWMEPLNQFSVGLYSLETDYRRGLDGWVKTRPFTWQAGTHNATDATPSERRKPEYNGPRNFNAIDGYSTGRFGDKKLWVISLRGTLSRVDLLTGAKEAIAGRIYKNDTVALDHADDTITQAQIDAANYEFVGNAVDPDHLNWFAPHDAYPCPWNPDNEVILLDSFNHRVLHVDASVSPAKVTKIIGNGQGRQAGPAATAKINRPYAVIVYPDRSFVLVCTPKAGFEPESAIFEVSADWQNVREICGHPAVYRPFWGCKNGDRKIVIWEHVTGAFKRVDLNTGAVTPWGQQWATVTNPFDGTTSKVLQPFAYARPDGWGQVVVDENGTIGQKGNIYFLTSQSSANTDIWCFGEDGIRFDGNFLKTAIGVASQGPANTAMEPHSHYPWWMDIHTKYACGAVQGFGNTAPHFFRLRQATDPKVTYDHSAYRMGEGMFWNGTLPMFPCDLRPSGRGLRNASGHSFLGNIPSLQDILTKSDDEVLAYMRAGAGGSVPRPEWDGEWGKALLYWLRWQDDNIRNNLVPPTLVKKPAPAITAFGYAKSDDGVTVTLTTDKPTFICVADGNGAIASDGYKTTHTLKLLDCGPKFNVLLADLDRNSLTTETITV